VRLAWERGERVRFITLTFGRGYRDLTMEDLRASWDDLAKLLRAGGPAPKQPPRGSGPAAQDAWRKACRRRRSRLGEYAAVVEQGTHGGRRLHLHVLATGEFIKQATLAKWARRCGFGQIAHITEVKRGSELALASYASKMAGYVSKTGQVSDEFLSRGAERVRPVRTSQNWYPGGLRRAEIEAGLRKPVRDQSGGPSPWIVLKRTAMGNVEWVPPRTREVVTE
jgi:hypothetical protein